MSTPKYKHGTLTITMDDFGIDTTKDMRKAAIEALIKDLEGIGNLEAYFDCVDIKWIERKRFNKS